MRKNLLILSLGIVAGAFLGAVVAIKFDSERNYDFGRHHGEILTKLAIADKISEALGEDYYETDGYRTLYEVKADAVVIVERNGVKTLRVYRPSHPQGTEAHLPLTASNPPSTSSGH